MAKESISIMVNPALLAGLRVLLEGSIDVLDKVLGPDLEAVLAQASAQARVLDGELNVAYREHDRLVRLVSDKLAHNDTFQSGLLQLIEVRNAVLGGANAMLASLADAGPADRLKGVHERYAARRKELEVLGPALSAAQIETEQARLADLLAEMAEIRREILEQPITTDDTSGAGGTTDLGGGANADILADQEQLSAALEDVREERFAAENQHLDAIVELNQTAAADVAGAFRGGLSEVRRQFRTLEFDARAILGAIVGDLAGSLFDLGIGSVNGGGLLGLLGTWFQGGFAQGGQVAADRPALVGEQGPELFVPGAPGTIVPNGALGASVAVYQAFNVNEGATEGAVRMLATVAGEIKRQTIAAVIDGQRRTAGALL